MPFEPFQDRYVFNGRVLCSRPEIERGMILKIKLYDRYRNLVPRRRPVSEVMEEVITIETFTAVQREPQQWERTVEDHFTGLGLLSLDEEADCMTLRYYFDAREYYVIDR